MANTKNIDIDQGATFTDYVLYLNTNNTGISLSDYTVSSQMRRSYYSANAITIAASIVDSANGNIQISLSSTVTANLRAGRYVYDVEAKSNTKVARVTEGIITVYPGVTNG
jgi:hypothetical protein